MSGRRRPIRLQHFIYGDDNSLYQALLFDISLYQLISFNISLYQGISFDISLYQPILFDMSIDIGRWPWQGVFQDLYREGERIQCFLYESRASINKDFDQMYCQDALILMFCTSNRTGAVNTFCRHLSVFVGICRHCRNLSAFVGIMSAFCRRRLLGGPFDVMIEREIAWYVSIQILDVLLNEALSARYAFTFSCYPTYRCSNSPLFSLRV